MSNSQIAVFIDFENLAFWAAETEGAEFKLTSLMDFLQTRGRVVIKRAYANWRYFESYRQELQHNAVDLIQVYSDSRGKNRADIRLVIDALETAFTHDHIDMFVVVSGDSDFGPLVSKLREHGRHTLGIGPGGRTHALLVKSCDEFIYLEQALGEASRSAKNGQSSREAARRLLQRALSDHNRQGNLPVLAAQLKMTMRRLDRDFDESTLGYPQFKSWLTDNADLVKLIDRDMALYVAPAEFPTPGAGGREAKTLGPEAARSLLRQALLGFVQRKEMPAPASKLKGRMLELEPTFSEAALGYQQFKAWLEEQTDIARLIDKNQVLYVALAAENEADDGEATAANPDNGDTMPDSPLETAAPALKPLFDDMRLLHLPDDLPRAAVQARDLFDKAMAVRSQNFTAAAYNFLQACRIQLEAIAAQDPAADEMDFRWYLASYASSKAGEMSQVHNDYANARRYYLAFFALAQEDSPVTNRVNRLINPMLSYYWVNAFRELGQPTEGWHPGNTTPAQILLKAMSHPNKELRQHFQQLTADLSKVNPRLLQQIAAEAREQQTSPA
jgi:uncharacterized LabA/DUF88 family protein